MNTDLYNILHEHINEFLSLFFLVFDVYLNISTEGSKLGLLHEFLKDYFIHSKKNTNEEMYYVFKNIIIKKLFDAINSPEFFNRVKVICDLIFTIFDPNEKSQVEFFKLFKDSINDEETLYSCFNYLHELFPTYPDNFIDICLFYVISGLSNQCVNIRYNSLNILYKYILLKNDFFYTNEKKLTRLSTYETCRDSAYLLLKMSISVLKNINNIRIKLSSSNVKKSIFVDRGDEESSASQSLISDMNIPNKIISNIFKKFSGDDIFSVILITNIGQILNDNIDLIKIFLNSIYTVPEHVRNYILYNDEVHEKLDLLRERTEFKESPEIITISEWNYALLFKGYILWLLDNKRTDFTIDFDYKFLNFCLKNPLLVSDNEIWRKFFSHFYKLFFVELKNPNHCGHLLNVIEKFFFFDTIQKPILDVRRF